MMTKRAERGRVWRLPDMIAQRNTPFALDNEVRGARLQARWLSVDDAIAFGRAALRVAIEDAIENEGVRQADQFHEFDRTSELAKRAHDALRALVRQIGPEGLPIGFRLPPQRWRYKGKPGKVSLIIVGRRKDKRPATREDAKKEIEELASARDLVKEILSRSEALREQLKHTTRIRDRDYGKQAFVYRLAEGWIFLTGRLPSLGAPAANNPFLRFVAAALNDAGQDDEDCYRALRFAVDRLKSFESFAQPNPEKTGQSISGIAAHGPAWF